MNEEEIARLREVIANLERDADVHRRALSQKEATVAALNERVAHLEEADAGRCAAKPISKEEWRKEFK